MYIFGFLISVIYKLIFSLLGQSTNSKVVGSRYFFRAKHILYSSQRKIQEVPWIRWGRSPKSHNRCRSYNHLATVCGFLTQIYAYMYIIILCVLHMQIYVCDHESNATLQLDEPELSVINMSISVFMVYRISLLIRVHITNEEIPALLVYY